MQPAVIEDQDYRAVWMAREYRRLIVVRTNELYYGRMADKLRKWARALAIGAAVSSSAAVLVFVQQWGPQYAAALSALGAVFAVIASAVSWNVQISSYEKAAMGYGIARARLTALLCDVQLRQWEPEDEVRAGEVDGILTALLPFDDAPDKKLLEQCQKDAEHAWPSVESVI